MNELLDLCLQQTQEQSMRETEINNAMYDFLDALAKIDIMFDTTDFSNRLYELILNTPIIEKELQK